MNWLGGTTIGTCHEIIGHYDIRNHSNFKVITLYNTYMYGNILLCIDCIKKIIEDDDYANERLFQFKNILKEAEDSLTNI